MLAQFKHFFKPLYLYSTSREYRKLQRLKSKYGNKEQYTAANIKFDEFQIQVPDTKSFLDQYESIFFENCYAFATTSNTPIIYDCGANVGLAALYLGRSYPNAKIYCFEADPIVAQFLKKNLTTNHSQATIIEKAVWINNHGVNFLQEGGQGGRIENGLSKNKVDSVRLQELLSQERKVDFLKLDIEGAELAVLKDCASELNKVDALFVEFHFYSNGENKLSELLSILESANFNYFLQNNSENAPFLKQSKKAVSFTVEIFATKNNL